MKQRKQISKKQNRIDMAYELKKATKEMERNKRLIEAGETYRSQKPKGPEKSPSHYKARF